MSYTRVMVFKSPLRWNEIMNVFRGSAVLGFKRFKAELPIISYHRLIRLYS